MSSPHDASEAIATMPDAHLHCRDYGHAWRAHTARYLTDQRVYEQQLRCTRCRTIRKRLLDRQGDVVRSGYVYVKDYQLRGLGRLTGSDKGMLRLASLNATLAKHDGLLPDA